jgi:hypothetical protein
MVLRSVVAAMLLLGAGLWPAEARRPSMECISTIEELREAVLRAELQVNRARLAAEAPSARSPDEHRARQAAIREAEFQAVVEFNIRTDAILRSCAPGMVVEIPTISALITAICDFDRSLYRLDLRDPGISSTRTLCVVRAAP